MVIIKDVQLKSFELRFRYTDINKEQAFQKQRQFLRRKSIPSESMRSEVLCFLDSWSNCPRI